MTFDAMRRSVAVTILAVVTALSIVGAQQGPQSPGALFERARLLEENSKSLNEAIALYKQVAAQAGSNRALAAQALLRAAECYQKLGDAEARTIYARIVKEFPDQKEEVARASARLGSAAAVASLKGDRAVWTGPNVDATGRVSPDGRFITYIDRSDGRLMIHDVAANLDRALTPASVPLYSQSALTSAMSRDSKQIVYLWRTGRTQNDREVRIAALPESGYLEPRRFVLANIDVVTSFDWSPDGRWIAAAVRRPDGTGQIGVIAVADGTFRSLKSVNRNVLSNPTSIFFSLDGKYLAYDRRPTDTSQQRDVFVLAIDKSGDIPAVVHSAHDVVMGWSPDGTWLLFSSDRLGTVDLWAQPFADGRAHGSPERLKSNIGSSVSMGLTESGALYVHKPMSTRDVAIAPIDLEAGTLLGPPVNFTQGFVDGARNPTWSPDGKYLAYSVTCNNGNGCLAIRSVATGQVRRLAPTLSRVGFNFWSPDGRSLLAAGTAVGGRDGIFQIDVQSGEATAVIMSDGLGPFTGVSPDGKRVYFNRGGVFIERDLASGEERRVNRETEEGLGALSPDGQYLAVARADRPTNTASLLLVPVAGGQPRELLRLTPREALFRPAGGGWMPDSSALIVQRHTGSRWELWLVPVTGGRPRKLAIDPSAWREGTANSGGSVVQQGGEGSVVQNGDAGFSLSPDGRNIAIVMGKTVAEVWALENFLPTRSAAVRR